MKLGYLLSEILNKQACNRRYGEWPTEPFDTSVQLDRESAHSVASVLLASFFFLDLDFRNAVHRGYCCGGWAVSLPYCSLERIWPLAISDRCEQ